MFSSSSIAAPTLAGATATLVLSESIIAIRSTRNACPNFRLSAGVVEEWAITSVVPKNTEKKIAK